MTESDDSPAARLADRFRDDAAALRARARVLAARSPKERGGGPDAASCNRMADACDRVGALFAGATALAAVAPVLDQMLAAERGPDVRHVYAGAVERLRQVLHPDDADEDDDDDDDEDED